MLFLLEYLLAEFPTRDRLEIPPDYAERRALFRALVNVRAPGAVSSGFLAVQDAFLQEEARQKGLVTWESLSPCKPGSRMALWQGDITRLAVDAIVNAANSELLGCFAPGHQCIDNAIHTAAGVQLREECHSIMRRQGHPEKPGRAKVSGAYNLPAYHVIHTVGPQVTGSPTEDQRRELAECYTACLNAAAALGIRSVAFCCISTGVFAFPRKQAAEIAVHSVQTRLDQDKGFERILFNVFLDEDKDIYESLLNSVCLNT